MDDKGEKPGLTRIDGGLNALVKEAFHAILRNDMSRYQELRARIERNPPILKVITGGMAETETPAPASTPDSQSLKKDK